MNRLLSLLPSLLLATPAHAHPGHDAGFLGGLAHPMLGADHLLAALLVGLWASQLGGRARIAIPLLFVATVGIAAVAAIYGFAPPAIETGILISMLVPGLLLASAVRAPLPAVAALVACFAWMHGAAHGVERPDDANTAAYLTGLLLTTGMLHAIGVGTGAMLRAQGLRVAGSMAVVLALIAA
ncbi:HupE/UreJ family protein [Roseiterribacter gracilis]|uniref:Protein hupE n=1 Tax=Roseiterribacter gracilis TaxID=2812848 RepID=A0A8S8XDF5_9PROT|nr:protein hupE [Rhodospirillales bacterium TMPK1]